MPPKVKITREEIVHAAVDLVHKAGEQAINARMVAAMLNCSTQPIFSNFASMDQLRMAVVEAADEMCNDYLSREVAAGELPPYKASGMAYIRFAKEERELFKLLYMRDRAGEVAPKELELSSQMSGIIHSTTGLDGETMKLFHLEMWAYVHGIATMFATGFVDLPWDLVERMLTDAFLGLRKQYQME